MNSTSLLGSSLHPTAPRCSLHSRVSQQVCVFSTLHRLSFGLYIMTVTPCGLMLQKPFKAARKWRQDERLSRIRAESECVFVLLLAKLLSLYINYEMLEMRCLSLALHRGAPLKEIPNVQA